jgi:gas vesicle protein
MASKHSGAGTAYLGWFLFGATLGGLAALLLAPRTGEENRELLTERGSELARRAQELAVDAQGVAGQWVEKSRELLEEQTQRLMGAFEAGRDAMREEMRKGTPPGA